MKTLFVIATLALFTYVAVTSVLRALEEFDEEIGL